MQIVTVREENSCIAAASFLSPKKKVLKQPLERVKLFYIYIYNSSAPTGRHMFTSFVSQKNIADIQTEDYAMTAISTTQADNKQQIRRQYRSHNKTQK